MHLLLQGHLLVGGGGEGCHCCKQHGLLSQARATESLTLEGLESVRLQRPEQD